MVYTPSILIRPHYFWVLSNISCLSLFCSVSGNRVVDANNFSAPLAKKNYSSSSVAKFFYNFLVKDISLFEKLGLREDEDYNIIGPNLNISLKPITRESMSFLGTPDFFLTARGFFYPRPWVKEPNFPTRGTFLSSVRIQQVNLDKGNGERKEVYYSGNAFSANYMSDLLVIFFAKIVLDKSSLSEEFKTKMIPAIYSYFYQPTCNSYKCGTVNGMKFFLFLRQVVLSYFAFLENPSDYKLPFSLNAYNCKIQALFSSFYTPILHEWHLETSFNKDNYYDYAFEHNYITYLFSDRGYDNVTFNIPFTNEILFLTYKGSDYLFSQVSAVNYPNSLWDITENHSLLIPAPFKNCDIYNVNGNLPLALYRGDNDTLLSLLSKHPKVLSLAISGTQLSLLRDIFQEMEYLRINPKQSDLVEAFGTGKLQEKFALYLFQKLLLLLQKDG